MACIWGSLRQIRDIVLRCNCGSLLGHQDSLQQGRWGDVLAASVSRRGELQLGLGQGEHWVVLSGGQLVVGKYHPLSCSPNGLLRERTSLPRCPQGLETHYQRP